jgi:hypothetical protein
MAVNAKMSNNLLIFMQSFLETAPRERAAV